MNEIIKQKLADRQHTARKIANDNLQKVFSVPKLTELYKQKQKLTIQKAKASAYGEPFDISQLNNITNELETELKKINLSIEDLSPKYFCPICQDTGIVEGKVCDCVKKLQSELNLKQTQFNNLKTLSDLIFYDEYQDKCSFPQFEQILSSFFTSSDLSLKDSFKEICGNKRKFIMNNAVILAGGQGKRMKAEMPKPLFKVLGEPIFSNFSNKSCFST